MLHLLKEKDSKIISQYVDNKKDELYNQLKEDFKDTRFSNHHLWKLVLDYLFQIYDNSNEKSHYRYYYKYFCANHEQLKIRIDKKQETFRFCYLYDHITHCIRHNSKYTWSGLPDHSTDKLYQIKTYQPQKKYIVRVYLRENNNLCLTQYMDKKGDIRNISKYNLYLERLNLPIDLYSLISKLKLHKIQYEIKKGDNILNIKITYDNEKLFRKYRLSHDNKRYILDRDRYQLNTTDVITIFRIFGSVEYEIYDYNNPDEGVYLELEEGSCEILRTDIFI